MTIQQEPEPDASLASEGGTSRSSENTEARVEEELHDADEVAGFDLEADVGHPFELHAKESFDIQADLGFGNGPR